MQSRSCHQDANGNLGCPGPGEAKSNLDATSLSRWYFSYKEAEPNLVARGIEASPSDQTEPI
jgi:hypothetical protein